MRLESVAIGKRIVQFDLSLLVAESEKGTALSFEYDSDLFDAATIARFAGNFETLLQSFAVEPSVPVSRLPLLTPSEQQQLQEWNNAASTFFARDRGTHEMFQEQVERTPEQLALVAGAVQLSYLESTAGQINWPIIFARWELVQSLWWASSWNDRWTWLSGCSAF